jgi:pimeloyl-ACP methyl ester carboxylesterase
MSTFVLVHGAWHGGWCWYKVVARLERLGHRVVAPDLVGLATARAPADTVTLDAWTSQIATLVERAAEPVVLVGHSRGGIVVSGVAERVPERVARLVYVAAFLLKDGQSLLEVSSQGAPTRLTGQLRPGPEPASTLVADEAIRPAFYGECSDDDVALARLLLTPEPMPPLATPVRVSSARFGRVPRTYVECLRDQAIHIDTQRAMHAAWPGTRAVSIDTDHSPFFSRPDELVEALV